MPAASPAAPTSWLDNVQDKELRKGFEKYASLDDALKASVSLRQKLSNAVALPGENATEDEIKEFRSKLGVPDSPDAYKYTRPELPENLQPDEQGVANEKDFVAAMHKVHAAPEHVQSAIDWYYNALQAGVKAQQEADKAYAEESAAALRREWGKDYDRNLNSAHMLLKEYTTSDAELADLQHVETKDGKFLLDHPALLRVFARAGLAMTEALVGPQHLPDGERQTLQEQINKIKSDAMSKNTYWTPEVQSQIQSLYDKLHGTEPIKGTAGEGMRRGAPAPMPTPTPT